MQSEACYSRWWPHSHQYSRCHSVELFRNKKSKKNNPRSPPIGPGFYETKRNHFRPFLPIKLRIGFAWKADWNLLGAEKSCWWAECCNKSEKCFNKVSLKGCAYWWSQVFYLKDFILLFNWIALVNGHIKRGNGFCLPYFLHHRTWL